MKRARWSDNDVGSIHILCRKTLGAMILLVALLLNGVAAHAVGPCRSEVFEGIRYTVCSFNLAESDLRLFWRDASGRPYLAMNAGSYRTDFTPIGLYVENGQKLRSAKTGNAPAGVRPRPNFYKKPNGVFYTRGNDARRTAVPIEGGQASD